MLPRLLLVLAFLGCAHEGVDGRTAWLHSTLVADNRMIFERFPVAAGEKLAKMASGPFAFLRGTAAQFARDVLEPGPHHVRTRFGSAAASRRLLLGDAHLENVGTFYAGRVRLLVDFNDFDAATFGPYHLDVWRLCVSIGVALHAEPAGLRVRWMRAAALAYAEEIQALADGGAPFLADDPRQTVLADLLRRAQQDGDAGTELAAYTRVADGQRLPFVGQIEPPGAGFVEDETVAVGPGEVDMILAALAGWPSSLIDPGGVPGSATRVRGITRRLGAGVSSYPLPRYYVILEGSTPAVADDLLIELKEASDPVVLPGVLNHPQPRFSQNAERVVTLQRRLQAYLDDDPLLGAAALGTHSFRVRAREGYQKNLSVARLQEKYAEGDWTAADLEQAFAAIARLLARAHGGAEGSDHHLGAPVIAAAIGGQAEAFAQESSDFSLDYAEVVLDDFERFKNLLQDFGPLLGHREL